MIFRWLCWFLFYFWSGFDEKHNEWNEGIKDTWFIDFGIVFNSIPWVYILQARVAYALLFVQQLSALQYRRMDFEEFCAAAVSIHQLEALDRWEQHARYAYDLFEKDGNRPIVIEELASVCLICLCDETEIVKSVVEMLHSSSLQFP